MREVCESLGQRKEGRQIFRAEGKNESLQRESAISPIRVWVPPSPPSLCPSLPTFPLSHPSHLPSVPPSPPSLCPSLPLCPIRVWVPPSPPFVPPSPPSLCPTLPTFPLSLPPVPPSHLPSVPPFPPSLCPSLPLTLPTSPLSLPPHLPSVPPSPPSLCPTLPTFPLSLPPHLPFPLSLPPHLLSVPPPPNFLPSPPSLCPSHPPSSWWWPPWWSWHATCWMSWWPPVPSAQCWGRSTPQAGALVALPASPSTPSGSAAVVSWRSPVPAPPQSWPTGGQKGTGVCVKRLGPLLGQEAGLTAGSTGSAHCWVKRLG